MDIDTNAPVKASARIDIAAPPQAVWDVLTDFPGWPSWNPDVRSMSIDGPLAAGSTFRWKAGPSTIRSTLRAVEPPLAVAWTGRTMGMDAVHVWRLEESGGGTRVTTEESWSGLLPRLMRSRLTRSMRHSLEQSLGYLKTEVEGRARPRRASAA